MAQLFPENSQNTRNNGNFQNFANVSPVSLNRTILCVMSQEEKEPVLSPEFCYLFSQFPSSFLLGVAFPLPFSPLSLSLVAFFISSSISTQHLCYSCFRYFSSSLSLFVSKSHLFFRFIFIFFFLFFILSNWRVEKR